MTSQEKTVHLPSEINSSAMGRDGRPADATRPLAPEMPNDDTRSRFPATGGGLMDEIRKAAEDDGSLASSYTPPAGGTVQMTIPEGGGSGGGAASVPPVSGMIEGGKPSSSRNRENKPVVEFLNPAKQGIDYPLEEPLRVDGVEYRTTHIKSPAGSRYGMFQQLTAEAGDDQDRFMANLIWLLTDLPLDVAENLHIDDREEIARLGFPFLPRRLRLLMDDFRRANAAIDQAIARGTAASSSSGTEEE